MVTFNYWLEDRWSKISLELDRPDVHRIGGSTDEGYSYTTFEFTLEEGLVRLEISNASQDCDGRMDSYRELVCPLDKLEDVIGEDDGVESPDWQSVDAYQRDYAAEAAGY